MRVTIPAWFVVLTLPALVGWAAAAAQRNETIVSQVDAPLGKIRIDVYGHLNEPIILSPDEQLLPRVDRLRAEMRHYAAIQLKNRGLCPLGFEGPTVVLGPENDRDHLFFFVTCKPDGAP